jgi:uncharacterized protein (DUF58 family)
VTITKAGFWYIAITLLIGFAAVNTGNNLLFLIVSSLLGFMAVSGFLGWLNLRNLGVTVVLPDEIYDGRDTLVTVRLANRKTLLSVFLLSVDVSGAGARFSLVERGCVESDTVTLRFHGRGTKLMEKVTISSPFPINFFVRRKLVTVSAPFTVFPSPRECPALDGMGMKDARGEAFSRRKGFGGEVAAIRDYTGSDPLKLIHWRLSARHTEFKVKETAAPSEDPLIIDVLSLPGVGLEENLSCAAYLVNRGVRANRPVGLKLGARFVRPDLTRTHRLRLLTELAVYGTR